VEASLVVVAVDCVVKACHLRPMRFGVGMVLGRVAVLENQPAVDAAGAGYARGDRFIGIWNIMPIVAVEITKAVTQIPERQEIKDDVSPVEQEHYKERGRERSQLKIAPE